MNGGSEERGNGMEVNDCISSLCSLYSQLPLGSAIIYKRLRIFRSLVVLVLYDFLPLAYIHIDGIAKMPINLGSPEECKRSLPASAVRMNLILPTDGFFFIRCLCAAAQNQDLIIGANANLPADYTLPC